eukprot:5779761-Pleurochrysis_carterae.AAC.1
MVAVARVLGVVDAMLEARAKASPRAQAVEVVAVVIATQLAARADGASSSGVGSGNADVRRGKGYQ